MRGLHNFKKFAIMVKSEFDKVSLKPNQIKFALHSSHKTYYAIADCKLDYYIDDSRIMGIVSYLKEKDHFSDVRASFIYQGKRYDISLEETMRIHKEGKLIFNEKKVPHIKSILCQ